jgi:hypothetical protein
MKILIDSLGLQARVHLEDGQRLAGLIANMTSKHGFQVAFSQPVPLNYESLYGYDVLIITTRKKTEADYTEMELHSIINFVKEGGGLLLMSNHGDIYGRPYPDLTASDARLAQRFEIEIKNTFYASREWGQPVEISDQYMSREHPIFQGVAQANPVHHLIVNNCCSIMRGTGIPLVHLPTAMHDYRQHENPLSQCFAIARDSVENVIRGRIVVTADSGFIGSPRNRFPGKGLLDRGDNLQFIINTILWLGKIII